jgi:hypothetical protein
MKWIFASAIGRSVGGEGLVVPYRPPLMVDYEGDNDLAGSKIAAHVFDDYQQFAARVEQHLPGTAVVFLVGRGGCEYDTQYPNKRRQSRVPWEATTQYPRP